MKRRFEACRGSRWAQRTVHAAVILLLLVNGVFVVWAARTVAGRQDRAAFERAAAAYIAGQPAGSVYVSARVAGRLRRLGRALPSSATDDPRSARLLIFETDEGFRHRGDWPAHIWDLTETWFGPWEVNFDRYPTWDGDSRIIVMTQARARQVGLPLVTSPP